MTSSQQASGLHAVAASGPSIRLTVDHEDAVWYECPRTGKAFKVQRVLQSARLWDRNPKSRDPEWAAVQIGSMILATRTEFP